MILFMENIFLISCGICLIIMTQTNPRCIRKAFSILDVCISTESIEKSFEKAKKNPLTVKSEDLVSIFRTREKYL
jgi:hypothetical protein